MADKTKDLRVDLLLNAKQYVKGLKRAGGDAAEFADRINTKLKAVAKTAAIVTAAFGVLTTYISVKAIKAASDYEEIMAKFNTVFRGNAKEVQKWSDAFAKAVGASRTEMANMMASTQDLFVPLGFTRTVAAEMSKTVSKLTIDLASFNNAARGDVLRDMQAALTGSFETMKKYGVVINETIIKQEAFRRGLIKTKTKALLPQQKAQIALQLILKGTTDAQGDAMRTANSWANTMRRAGAGIQNILIAIGTPLKNLLLPVLASAAKILGKMAKPLGKIVARLLKPLRRFLKDTSKWMNRNWRNVIRLLVGVVIGVKKGLTPAFKVLSAAMGWLLRQVTQFTKAGINWFRTGEKIGKVMIWITNVIGILQVALGAIGIASVTAGLIAVASTIGLIPIAITAVIAAVALAVTWVVKRWGHIKAITKKLFKEIKAHPAGFYGWMKDRFKSWWVWLKAKWAMEWPAFSGKISNSWKTDIKPGIIAFWAFLKKTATDSWEELKQDAAAFWNLYKDAFSGNLDFLKEKAKEFWVDLKAIVAFGIEELKPHWEKYWSWIKEQYTALWDDIKKKGLGATVEGLIEPGIKELKGPYERLNAWLENLQKKDPTRKSIRGLLGKDFIDQLGKSRTPPVNVGPGGKAVPLGGTPTPVQISLNVEGILDEQLVDRQIIPALERAFQLGRLKLGQRA